MKYNGFYFALFQGTMKKVLTERCGQTVAVQTLRAARPLYRNLVAEMPDLGDGNPMAFNALFALAFVAPYLASGKQIPPETVQEMMRRSLLHVRFYFSAKDLNSEKGQAAIKKRVMKYIRWYNEDKQRSYPTSFLVDEVGKPYEDACYYRITRCPICTYCKRIGAEELMPLLCELDELMISLEHGVLHREQTIASGGAYCDYYITGERELCPSPAKPRELNAAHAGTEAEKSDHS